ncbi:MAG TPA: hypothetical protein VMZ29_05295 [Candidatus Bathyarchaeia archaeon]|nr:hypothetical protein [Candidatus Bathyarchaeia archaeon]
MILNAKNNMFTIWFPPHFFYPSIVKKWEPVVKRLKLPYQTIEDFFNASIQSLTFPALELPTPTQQQSEFIIAYKGGKELEPTFDKTMEVVFKLSEGFITYWIIFEQIEEYLRYDNEEKGVFWPSMYVSFLDMHGFELVAFEFNKIVPTGLSQFDVSYATTAADFNTFSLNLRYNRFNIKRRIDDASYSVGNS